ncbi:MAG: hypothetical protein RIQ94_15 [Pseudomonadota bacterium]|jgi:chemotaxis protein CheZ
MSNNLEDIDDLFEQAATESDIIVLPKVVSEVPGILSAPVENQALYDRLGSVVRQLHDALQQLGYGQILDDTLRDISDSQDRLEYIASLTEQSANKVLNAVDEGLPVQDEQIKKAGDLEQRWNDMLVGEFASAELKLLVIDSCSFTNEVVRNAEAEKARLMDIMMAQDFQDITGQIIKKVVTLTQKLEKELTQLLQDYAVTSLPNKSVDLLTGPSIPDLAMDQNDVDSMLADLGF